MMFGMCYLRLLISFNFHLAHSISEITRLLRIEFENTNGFETVRHITNNLKKYHLYPLKHKENKICGTVEKQPQVFL